MNISIEYHYIFIIGQFFCIVNTYSKLLSIEYKYGTGRGFAIDW